MLDINKPVQTRDGRKARIICSDMKGDYPIVACVEINDKVEEEGSFTENGNFLCSREQSSDLINAPEKHVRYLHLYDGGYTVLRASSDPDAAYGKLLGFSKVIVQEGQFDE